MIGNPQSINQIRIYESHRCSATFIIATSSEFTGWTVCETVDRMLNYAGKAVLVTGGSRGIGKAIALRLAEAGADVAISYLRDDDAAEQAAEELRKRTGRVEVVRGNVGDAQDVARLSAVVADRFGVLDILVSNAALGVFKPGLELRSKDWQWTMDASALSLLHLVQSLNQLLRSPGAAVIALSSLGAVRAIPSYAALGAAKAALESLARHLAMELGPRGIRVNVISPGLVCTDSLRHLPHADLMIQEAKRRTPAGRLVEPEEVADLVMFLGSPLARMISGQTIVIDGGYSIVA
jgi:enoyl-[acyl-carrier protein] reductase III